MADLTLKRPNRPRALISLVPMVDVLLILLVFFMVTSTYLNLDMIPAVRQQDQADSAPAASGMDAAGTLMIRLGADGAAVVRGRAMTAEGLGQMLRARLAEEPLTQVVVLPSGMATTQSLISVMDVATRAGVVRLRVIRLQARP